ncbi:MAG: hypothetical protein ABI618_10020 [Nitrospirota bacterium]
MANLISLFNEMDWWKFVAIFLAFFAAFTAYQQYILSRERFKLDLFEKRFAVFTGTRKFLSGIQVNSATGSLDGLLEYKKDIDQASFLFNEEMVSYLEEIYRHAVALGNTRIVLKDPETEAERKSFATKSHRDEYTWLTNQLPELIKRFSPYMKFKTWN